MAEPIRKPRPPHPHLPAPRPRPRGLPPPAPPPVAPPADPTPPAAPSFARAVRSRVFPRPVERRRRSALQAALGLHLAAVLLSGLSLGGPAALSRSELLLGAATLLAGGVALALGTLGRR